tara:strand:- start:163 stop:627 length:465 start_codon:yes stop_codon:yes gene_type:complete
MKIIEKLKSIRLRDIKLLTSKQVALGQGNVTQYTLFECKELFSIIFYRWNTIDQVRFHTHAFNAYAFLLKGYYHEKIISKGKTTDNIVNQILKPRFLAREYCHSIGYAKPNTMTLVITGSWQDTWQEYFPDTKKWVTYSWGRNKIDSKSYLQEL